MAKVPQKEIPYARGGFIVTPSDANEISADAGNYLGYTEVAFRAGTAGTIKFLMADDNADAKAITLTFVAGEWFPGSVKKIFSTGTTSTGIAAFSAFMWEK